ncbi:hypothetical protein KRM28CT15_30900 [Krasilnikovia sp. M28-CT-15]
MLSIGTVRTTDGRESPAHAECGRRTSRRTLPSIRVYFGEDFAADATLRGAWWVQSELVVGCRPGDLPQC